MSYLRALRIKYGFEVCLQSDGKVFFSPFPEEPLLTKIKTNKQSIVAELQAELAERCKIAEADEAKALRLFNTGTVRADQCDTLLLYAFRKAAAHPLVSDPCHCGETLFWRQRGESRELPLLCYSCFQPGEDIVAPECYLVQIVAEEKRAA